MEGDEQVDRQYYNPRPRVRDPELRVEVEETGGLMGPKSRVRIKSGTEGASSLSSVFTLCNTAIGAGVLSLPYAFECAGLVGCFILCLVVSSLESFTMYVLAKFSERYDATSYGNLAMEMVGVAQELRAGVDFTADSVHAVFERELELHRQIYAAIWSAVTAMECWSTGVNKWLGRVTIETNSWLATNAHIAAQNPSAAACMGYVPIPLPAQVDFSQSRTTPVLLAPAADGQSLQLQQQSDEEEQPASAATVRAGPGGVRLGADLQIAAVDDNTQVSRPASFNPRLLAIANQWVSSSGVATPDSATSLSPICSNNTRVTSSGVSLDVQRSQDGDMQAANVGWQRLISHAGRDVPQSPGGVSLHSRFAGQPPAPAGRLGVMATLRGFLGGQGADASSSEPSSSTVVTEVTTTKSPRPSNGCPSPQLSSASLPHSSGRTSADRVVPFAVAGNGDPPRLSPAPSAGAGSSHRSAIEGDLGFLAATSSSVGSTDGEVMPGSVAGDGDGDGVSARHVSKADRLPTVTGRVPRNRLQPIE